MSASLVASKEVHAKVKLLLSEQIVCQETHEDVGDLSSLNKKLPYTNLKKILCFTLKKDLLLFTYNANNGHN